MTASKYAAMFALAATIALTGCSGEGDSNDAGDDSATQTSSTAPSPELQPLVVKADPPANQIGVSMARSTNEGQEVAVEGRLKDFVDGVAAFTIVDGSVPSCLEDGMEEQCPTPWDYCCMPQELMAANTAMVKLLGPDGETLAGTLKGVNSIDNLSTVVVTGKVEKDESGNVTIAANKVYLK
jgi:hypothetical protein